VTKLSKHRVLISGIVSPLAALFLYVLVYATLTRFSADLEKDWLFRLSLSTLAMIVPFLVTLALAIEDSRERRHPPLETVPEPGDAGRGRAAL
jgi:hypothetical protein